jgi:hypothetical protein
MSDKKIPDIHVSICFDKDESKGESRLGWLMKTEGNVKIKS